MVAPPSDIPQAAAPDATPASSPRADRLRPAETEVRGQAESQAPAPALDIADIRPLDLDDALGILLAEVRAVFDLPGPLPALRDAPQAARAAVDIVLRALPREDSAAAWLMLLPRIDAALDAGLGRALDIVGNWREVPAAVLQAAQDAARLVKSALADDPANPLWVRPEWVGLAPALKRQARARRALKRRANDPDYWPADFSHEEDWREARSSTP